MDDRKERLNLVLVCGFMPVILSIQSHPIVRELFFGKYRYGIKRVTQFWQSVSDTMNILYSWTSILRRLLNNTILWYHTDRGISQVSILLVSTYYVWYWNRAGTRSTKKWYTIVREVLKMLANSSTGKKWCTIVREVLNNLLQYKSIKKYLYGSQ